MLNPIFETVIAVAEEKNFTKAAVRLSLTQPAVSRQIGLLEEELNAPLFIRKKGEIQPTQKGETVISYARRFIALEEKMKGELSAPEGTIGKIKIGITHTSESNIIPEVLGSFSKQNNKLSITIITDTIKNLYTMLENYELDLAIVDGKPSNPDLYSVMLDTDSLVCVVDPSHPLAHQPLITLNELKRQQMILRLPSSATRTLFHSSLESINQSADDFNVILEVDNIATIKDLIRKQLGVSILAKSTCLDELKKGKLAVLPIENLSMIRETNIVYNKNFNHVDIIKEIITAYREGAKNGV